MLVKEWKGKGYERRQKPFNRNGYDKESEGLWDIKKQKRENQ